MYITRKLTIYLKKFSVKKTGAIAVLFAVAIPTIIAAAGLAVDVTRYMRSGAYLQNAVDQAALAASVADIPLGYPTNGVPYREKVAKDFLKAALTEDIKKELKINNITVQEDLSEGISITVILEAETKDTLSSLLGAGNYPIVKTGEATRHTHNVEVVITISSAGSLCSSKEEHIQGEDYPKKVIQGDVMVKAIPTGKCLDHDKLKESITEFKDIVERNHAQQGISNVKIGILPYNYKVNFPDKNNIPPTVAKHEPENFYKVLGDAEPLSQILPLTGNYTIIENRIGSLPNPMGSIVWNRNDLAIHVAGLMLDPLHKAYFAGNYEPQPFSNKNTKKIIIMMTDGLNVGCCFTNWPDLEADNSYLYHYQPYNDAQLEMCKTLKDNNVEIYSILYGANANTSSGKEVNNIFTRCASGGYTDPDNSIYYEEDELYHPLNKNINLLCSGKQNCYDAADEGSILKSFKQIARTFYKPTITQ